LNVIARDLRPHYLTVGSERSTEAETAHRPEYETLLTYQAFISELLVATRFVCGPETELGAGMASWDSEYGAVATWLSQSPNTDFVNIHVYPVNAALALRIPDIIDVQVANGKKTVFGEIGLYKATDAEIIGQNPTAQEVYSRDAYDFWAPLDQKFLEAMYIAAQRNPLGGYMSQWWMNTLFAYLDYDDTWNLTATQRVNLMSAAASTAALTCGNWSVTGDYYAGLQ
jgi:hypothetical protein